MWITEFQGFAKSGTSAVSAIDRKEKGREALQFKPINIPEKGIIQATAWFEIRSNDEVRLFESNGKRYAISLRNAPKLIRQVIIERRTHPPDQRREILWHDFDLTGNSPDFPKRLDYLI